MEDPTENSNKEDDLFYFESDHLALKGNKDYSELLKTLFVLSAQREKAVKNYEIVQQIKSNALEDPGLFLEKLKNEDLEFPPYQNIAKIPFINWFEYDTKIPEEELKAIYNDEINISESDHLSNTKKENTHKQPWTSEEQKRLEELLVVYPPEPVELRRIKKIAAALGNRTVQQVSSRLQKYFIKLHKAGLHIPGRVPKTVQISKKNKHKDNSLWKPTTFFPQFNVSVSMDDTENIPGPSFENSPKLSELKDSNYLLATEYQQNEKKENLSEKSEKELQLELLKRIRAEKIKESEMVEPFRHLTYMCDYCNEDPILGTRWHCSTCVQESIDFCTDCLLTQLYSDNPHPLNHKLITLPHPDDPNFNISSDSDSDESANETNDMSDTDSSISTKSKLSNEIKSKNGLKSNRDDNSIIHNFEVSKFLNDLMYTDEKDLNSFSTQDISYNYLHSNLNLPSDD